MSSTASNTSRALPTTATQLGLGAEPLTAGHDDSIGTHLRAGIDAQLRVILERQQGLRSGDDPEDVHQMRVAVRKLRALLREEGAVLGEVADTLRAELKWLATNFGEVRDLDVLIENLTADAEALPEEDRSAFDAVLAAFATQRAEARKQAMRLLRTSRYRKLLQALADTVLANPEDPESAEAEPAEAGLSAEQAARPRADAPARGASPGELIRKPYRKLRADVSKAGKQPTDEQLHDLRIRGKRLRYSAEFSTPKGGKQAKRTKDLIKAAKQLQTVLGDHNDAVVAEQRLRELLAEHSLPPEAVIAAGRVIERRAERRAQYRAEWRRAWSSVDKCAKVLL